MAISSTTDYYLIFAIIKSGKSFDWAFMTNEALDNITRLNVNQSTSHIWASCYHLTLSIHKLLMENRVLMSLNLVSLLKHLETLWGLSHDFFMIPWKVFIVDAFVELELICITNKI